MQKFGFPAAMLLVTCAAFAFQAVEPARTSYERRGLYHATVRGRILSHTGEPVSGVHVQLNAGRPRSLPLVDVATGADGRFTMKDVNAIYSPYLSWFPPEQWLQGGISIAGESGEEIDVGTIRLQPNTIIRVAVELVGGPPLGVRDREATVVLEGNGGFGPRIVAESVGSERILRQIPFDDGAWEVSLFTNSKSEYYRAPFHVQRGRRDQKFTFRLLRDTVKPASQYHSEGQMEISETVVPAISVSREFHTTGRVLGPDGNAIEGAIVNVIDIPFRAFAPRWVRAGPQGNYDLSFQSAKCAVPGVSHGESDYWNLYTTERNQRDIPCEERLRTPRDIVMPTASHLSIRIDGMDESRARAYWWHDSFGWQRFPSLRPWISAPSFNDIRVKVEADGYLPLAQSLKFQYFDRSKDEQPPTERPLEFRFDGTARRSLSVRGGGKPLAGAIVDLESIENIESDRRQFLGTYSLQADGKLELLGASDQMVEAFVYAAGFEPKRAIWDAGVPLMIDLVARSTRLEFPASSTVLLARIRDSTSPRAVRTVKLNAGGSTSVPTAPGTYDITCYNNRGTVAGYQRVVVGPAQTTRVDCSADQRPRLTVRYPADGWRVSLSESTPRGGATQWAVMLVVGGVPGFAEVAATPERQSPREVTLALSHAGRMHLEARLGNQSLTLWREIDFQPNQSMAISIPQGSATLRGSMRTYGGGLERSDHGFAGPRMQLIADNPADWSVTEYLPERDARTGEERHRFTLTSLPAGNYHLYQHLIGESKTYSLGNQTTQYTAPIAAWGGIPVKLEASSTTQIQDFIDYPLSDLRVRVADATGRPIEHATLRIRDRMSESWRQVEENPAQLEQAGHPIPYPAAARIVGGIASLRRIREGWLDLLVENDAGPTFSFTVPVSPGHELKLNLPSPL